MKNAPKDLNNNIILSKEQADSLTFEELAEHHGAEYKGLEKNERDGKNYHTFEQTYDNGETYHFLAVNPNNPMEVVERIFTEDEGLIV